eukprot:4901771-Pyramimonas_sp.AAC.1
MPAFNDRPVRMRDPCEARYGRTWDIIPSSKNMSPPPQAQTAKRPRVPSPRMHKDIQQSRGTS